MIVLGLILIIVAAAAVLFALASGGTLTASPLTAIGVTVNVTPLAMFVAGAVSLLLVVLGLALISRGTKRSVHTRRELRQLRKGQSRSPPPLRPPTGPPPGGAPPRRHRRGERGDPWQHLGRPRRGAPDDRRRRGHRPPGRQRVPAGAALTALPRRRRR